LLDMIGVGSIKGRRIVGFWGILGLGAIGGFQPGVWSMLWTRCRRVFEALEGTFDVPWNGDVNNAVVIVPVNLEATEMRAGPILARNK